MEGPGGEHIGEVAGGGPGGDWAMAGGVTWRGGGNAALAMGEGLERGGTWCASGMRA